MLSWMGGGELIYLIFWDERKEEKNLSKRILMKLMNAING